MSANFRQKRALPTNQKTRLIALSRSIKISAVHCLFLSQSTRVTDGRTDGQNYDSQDRANIAASRGTKIVDRKQLQTIKVYGIEWVLR